MGYLDPNIFGIVSQVGFVVFFGITTMFVFFSKTMKMMISNIVRVLLRRSPSLVREEEDVL
jgi:hypothetical protein